MLALDVLLLISIHLVRPPNVYIFKLIDVYFPAKVNQHMQDNRQYNEDMFYLIWGKDYKKGLLFAF